MTPFPDHRSFRRPAVALACGAALSAALAAPAGAASTPSGGAPLITAGPTVGASSERTPKAAAPTRTKTAKQRVSTSDRATAKRIAAKKRAAAKKRSRKAKPLSEVSVADALARITPYAGPTGAVIHAKSVTVNFKTNDEPQQQRSFTSALESWAEIGGGRRLRELRTSTDPDTGASRGTQEYWRTDRIWLMASEGLAHAFVGVFCGPAASQEPGQLIREDQANLANLPLGPVVAGQPTRVSTHTHGAVPADGTPAEFRNYLHATTGAPLRTTYQAAYSDRIAQQTDYSLWEVQPAGGSAENLSSAVPTDAVFGENGKGCIG